MGSQRRGHKRTRGEKGCGNDARKLRPAGHVCQGTDRPLRRSGRQVVGKRVRPLGSGDAVTARRCDRCGETVVDAVGDRQTSLFDVQADPRATAEARDELRAGRILCTACQRTPELFPGDSEIRVLRVRACYPDGKPIPVSRGGGWRKVNQMSPVRITAPRDPFPRPVVDHWTRKDRDAMRRAEAHVDAAEMADAVAGLE